MGNRIHSDNCLLLFFCCGFLSVLGIIKGIILVGPIFIISLFGFTGVAIILLPHDIILTYRAICKTTIIGINIKILCMLLLPIALISWPFIIAFLSSLFGIFYGLFCPIIYTFNEDYDPVLGGFSEIFKSTFHYIGWFWDFNYRSYFGYLFEMEKRKVDNPFDITIIQMIIGLILASYGSIVGVIVLSFLWFIKLIPSIIQLYSNVINHYCEMNGLGQLVFFVIFLIVLVLIPFIVVLSILGYIGFGLYRGIYCAIEGYKYNIRRGIISIWNTILEFDLMCNEYLFKSDSYSFTCCCKRKSSERINVKYD